MHSDRFLITLIALAIYFLPANAISSAKAYNLPDTGQTKCYDNEKEIPCPGPGQPFYGQDAQYTSNPMSFTKLDSNGNPLPDSATSWEMVKDNNTGLIWQKSDDQNDTTARTWQEALNYCANLDLGQYMDWRLPKHRELLSIIDYGTFLPAIDTVFFPACKLSFYWSSTENARDDLYAWRIGFETGDSISKGYKTEHWNVRCVRGAQIALGEFHDNGDGTITDLNTGLIWQQDDQTLTWQQSLSYCEELPLANNDDWRLPNIRELQTLVDDTRTGEYALAPVFSRGGTYYASTTSARSLFLAWAIDFFFPGGETLFASKNEDSVALVRCVRGGLPPGTLKVTISPQEAIDAGARWRVDGGTWQNSGDSLPNLAVGNHALEFKKIPGWVAPMSRSVTISTDQTTTINETYRPVKSLSPILLMLD